MTTQITLKINSAVAERLGKYARKRKMSIDKIFEDEVVKLLQQEEVKAIVNELAGILKDVEVKDAKSEFQAYQLKKHSRGGKSPKRKLGFAKGNAWMAPDFDAPLEDMKKYK